jgi:hypothetical protein
MRNLLLLLLPGFVFAQYGPNNPASGTNVGGVGTLSWTSPGNILLSDNSDATQGTRGTTNYLQGTTFGFALLPTDVVTGIRMEVEKASTGVSNVALLGSWSVGTTRTLPAGTNRCLIVIIGLENATTRDITSVSYGGRTMTPVTEIGLATPFYARTEAWYLLESELALAANTTITYSFGTGTPSENFEIVSAAVYQNVDQIAPFFDTETGSTTSNSANFTLPNAMNVEVGSMAITGIFCGAPPDPVPGAAGSVNAFTINQSFTDRVDYYNYAAGYATSGGQLQVSDRAMTSAGTVQPQFTFDGSPNRRTVVAMCLRRARQLDNSVRIRKSTGFVGTDKAAAATEWPTTDTYSSYGGAGDLWGTTWTVAEINNIGFGGAISTIVQNGTATVDNIRITVFTSSVLPLELISFDAAQEQSSVLCKWVTATERNTDMFVVERSADGIHFEVVGTVKAAGDSESARYYEFRDQQPLNGMNYYRLKTVDNDGTLTDSDIVSAGFENATEVTVFPNPTNDWATIMTTDGFDEIVITDARGVIVDRFEGTTLETSRQLNLYDMPDGTYFVCVKSQNGAVEIKKLMKTTKSH